MNHKQAMRALDAIMTKDGKEALALLKELIAGAPTPDAASLDARPPPTGDLQPGDEPPAVKARRELAQRMGAPVRCSTGVQRTPTRATFGVLTPEEARHHVAAKAGRC